MGFYTYGNGAQQQYTLGQANNYQQVAQHIQGLQLSGGSADAGQAIRMAYREGFSAVNGGRTNVPQIIVHVSGGPAADPTLLYQEVKTSQHNSNSNHSSSNRHS